jgi:hypothetical protein
MADAPQSASDFLGADPAPSADAFLGPDPTATPTQTWGGAGQALSTVPARTATSLAGLPVDTLGNAYNIGVGAANTAKEIAAGTSVPAGETLTEDERATRTPHGLYHYIILDPTSGQLVDTFSKNPPPDNATVMAPKRQNPIANPSEGVNLADLPGSSEYLNDALRNVGGSSLVDVKENTGVNRLIQAAGVGAASGAVAPGSAIRGAVAGGIAGAAQQGAAETGVNPGVQAAIGFAAGGLAGAKGAKGEAPAAPKEAPAPVRAPAEDILDARAAANKANFEAAKPTPAPGEPVVAAPPAPTPQSKFMDSFNQVTEPHPVDPTQRKLGNVSIAATPDPTDPNTVHIQRFAADEPGKGSGTQAMGQLEDLADTHGTTLSLDAKPEAGAKPIPQDKLEAFYGNHGFEPTDVGGGAMERTPTGSKGPSAADVEVKEGAETPAAGSIPDIAGKPHTIISAEREGATPSENQNRTKVLGQMLQASGMPAALSGDGRTYAVASPGPADRVRLDNIGRTFGGQVTHVNPEGASEASASTGASSPPPGPSDATRPPTPTKAPVSIFGGPAQEGRAQEAKTPADQAARVETFKRVLGPDAEVRNSAITGDTRQAGTEFQTSKLKGNPAGDRIANLIADEREGVRQHAADIVKDAGGTEGLNQPDVYKRGSTMSDPIQDWHEHLEGLMNNEYETTKARLGQTPVKMNALTDALVNNQDAFEMTGEGSQLHKGIMMAAKRLKILDKDGNMQPATVEQVERLRQAVGDAWSPRVGRLVGALKGAMDEDVLNAAGTDAFARGRELRTLMSKTLEEPEAVSSLLQTKQANKLGVNRQVPLENVPGFITKQPFDQFNHYVDTLTSIANSKVPALRDKAIAALNETRGQFANEYMAAGDNQKGQWNQKAANKYLAEHEMQMGQVFKPEEMQKFKDNDDAGRWLSMDRSYPGAEAQKQNLAQHAAEIAGKGLTTAATGVGGTLGHLPGAAAGAAVGKVVSAGINKLAAGSADKLVTKLSDWKPPGGASAKPVNSSQRGSFSFENATPLKGAPRSKQSGGTFGGAERNPRSEYNANKQIAGSPTRTPEQNALLARMSQ